MSDPPLVSVDFNAMWDKHHVSLGTLGVKWDLERQGVQIADGLRLRAFDVDADSEGHRDNIVCEGVVDHLDGTNHPPKFDWLLAIDWIAHESDLRDDLQHWVHAVEWEHEERVRSEWRSTHPGAARGLSRR